MSDAGAAAGRHHSTERLREETRHIWQSDRSLTALLVFLVFTVFIADPLADLGAVGHFILGAMFTLVLLSGTLTVATTRLAAVVFPGVAVGSLLLHWARYGYWMRYSVESHPLEMLDALGTFCACGMLAGIVLVHVFREGSITIHRIQGAIAAYLLIGLMWAAIYVAIILNDPDGFAFATAPPVGSAPALRARFIYFSFTTLTTVGYGDITPLSPVARSMSMLEAIIGQLFPAILIARLVSLELYYRQRRFEREQAELDRKAVAGEIARQLRESGEPQ